MTLGYTDTLMTQRPEKRYADTKIKSHIRILKMENEENTRRPACPSRLNIGTAWPKPLVPEWGKKRIILDSHLLRRVGQWEMNLEACEIFRRGHQHPIESGLFRF